MGGASMSWVGRGRAAFCMLLCPSSCLTTSSCSSPQTVAHAHVHTYSSRAGLQVSEVAWVGLAELSQRMAADPAAFTPWFRDEAAALGMV